MNYLLDTCIISEFTAKQPNQRVVDWLDQIDDERLFLSVITIGEIQRGIFKLADSQRKRELARWLESALLVRFHGRILSVDVAVMLKWGELTAHGRTLPAMDSLIAALALQHNLLLVTRNVKDFEGAKVKVVNPWET